MDLRETSGEVVDWIHLAQDSEEWCVIVKTIMKLKVPQKREFLE
jgi:hypothetical protein